MPQLLNKKYRFCNSIKLKTDRGIGSWPLLISLLLLCAIFGILVSNEQNILDWWALRNYSAPAVVSQLATQDTMTAYARKIYYVNHPAIDLKSAFNVHCPNDGGEQTIVLGCYHSNQAGIFLLCVNDPRLNGVEQVTAAHEMLHAAYDRLSSSEKNKVDAMLLNYYNHDLHDPRIISTIAAYKRTEPNNVVNEMHSVFGTEIADLPSGLEQYYTRYFTDREKIAAYAAQYQAAFTSRQTAVTTDDNQLNNLKSQIDSSESNLKTMQASIDSQQSQLITERNSNINAYNADVPAYNQQVDVYNNQVTYTQNLIAEYNNLVTSRNSIAFQEDQLIGDLTGNDSTLSQ
jgi:hypothetical protein